MVLINYITKFAFQTHCWKYDKKKESGFGEWGFAICYRCLPDRFIETLLYRFVFGVHCPSLLVRSICRIQHWSSHFTQNRSLALGPNRARLSLASVCMLEVPITIGCASLIMAGFYHLILSGNYLSLESSIMD